LYDFVVIHSTLTQINTPLQLIDNYLPLQQVPLNQKVITHPPFKIQLKSTMRKAILTLGIIVGAWAPLVSQAQLNIHAGQKLLVANRLNHIHFNNSNQELDLEEAFISSELPVRVVNASTLDVLAPKVEENGPSAIIKITFNEEVYEFSFQLKTQVGPEVAVYSENRDLIGKKGILASTQQFIFEPQPDPELLENAPNTQRYRVSRVKLTLANGMRPLGDFEYTAENLQRGIADLNKLYHRSSRTPQPGDRIVIEVLEMLEMQADNSVVAIQPTVPPRSIPIR